MILVIVESPNKTEKINSIVGKDYKVTASVGHIIDLDPKGLSVDIENNFTPIYIEMPLKQDVIKNLKKLYKQSDDIILATDNDREGEMIAWSIAHVLKLKNPKRIVFNSITKKEVLDAIKHPKKIDDNLVEAQKSRRILDRLVGYQVSGILQKTIRAKSAGRVQSIVVRLILDKEKEIEHFFKQENSSYFKTFGEFKLSKTKFESLLYQKQKSKIEIAKIASEKKIKDILSDLIDSTYLIDDIQQKEEKRYPSPPFTTSTLQQEANRKLGFSIKRTMDTAQRLYEQGKITYHRTDAVHLSEDAMEHLKEFIIDSYGQNYYNKKQYQLKNDNAQEAHEAIRPTDICIQELSASGKIGNDEIKLYKLIWKRSVASQMKPAIYDVVNIDISISKLKEYIFRSVIKNLKFDGFLKVYNISNLEKDDDPEEESMVSIDKLPSKGDELKLDHFMSKQEFERPPTRFNEASLVKQLDPEHLNIGRPSTYAAIISKVLERKYVEKKDIEGIIKQSVVFEWKQKDKTIQESKLDVSIGKESNKMVPTDLGRNVTEFLMKQFPELMDYKFTAEMEENLDKIASGKKSRSQVLKEFYNVFEPLLEKAESNALKTKESIMRLLGKHPETGLDVHVSIANNKDVIRMCPKRSKCIYVDIPDNKDKDKITLEEALVLLKEKMKYPKLLGKHKKKDVEIINTSKGLFIKYSGNVYKLEQDTDDLDKVISIIDEFTKDIIHEFEKDKIVYYVKQGKHGYGDYIQVKYPKGKPRNIPVPKDVPSKELTLEKVLEIVSTPRTRNPRKKFEKTMSRTNLQEQPSKKTLKKTSNKTSKKTSKKKMYRKKKDE
jgi:DNA topoisomerase-1